VELNEILERLGVFGVHRICNPLGPSTRQVLIEALGNAHRLTVGADSMEQAQCCLVAAMTPQQHPRNAYTLFVADRSAERPRLPLVSEQLVLGHLLLRKP
jgi:hypothetical protein